MQASLFLPENDQPNRVLLPLPGAEVWYYPRFFSKAEHDILFKNLLEECKWKMGEIVLFGKKVMQPRLLSWHGNPEIILRYSGSVMEPEPWTPTLNQIKTLVEAETGLIANGVLANQYRNGQDSMGWHADDERELGPEPVIPSLSFGAERLFRFKHKTDKSIPVFSLRLAPGSMLLMQGQTQTWYKHELPKSNQDNGKRINLTFRKMVL